VQRRCCAVGHVIYEQEERSAQVEAFKHTHGKREVKEERRGGPRDGRLGPSEQGGLRLNNGFKQDMEGKWQSAMVAGR